MGRILFIGILLTLFSCDIVNVNGTSKINDKINLVEIGMTKEQVVSIMGTNYQNINAAQTPEGVLSVIKYNEVNTYAFYMFYFLDGKLAEWNRDYDSESLRTNQANQRSWQREQERKKEHDEIIELKKKELQILEEAHKKK